MSNRFLLKAFADWRSDASELALITVIRTDGSTYSKAGRQVLARRDGRMAGLVSGGCLETDLHTIICDVLDSGEPCTVTYDMRDSADELWGVGLGCNGLMELLVQPLSAADWQPFATLAGAMNADRPQICALTIAGNDALPMGSAWCLNDPPGPLADTPPATLPAIASHSPAAGPVQVLYWRTQPWPRLLILGAGPDAVPLVRLAHTLGWQITVADHRPAYLEHNDFSGADACQLVEPGHMADTVDSDAHSAIVIMSNHLATDHAYLKELATAPPAYLGLLGPLARRQRLLDDLGLQESPFAQRLHGPAGLQIGADSPETIALAIISEIQQTLSNTN